jgi:hypothetical protein
MAGAILANRAAFGLRSLLAHEGAYTSIKIEYRRN